MKKFIALFCATWSGYALELNDFVADRYPDVYQNTNLLPFDPRGYHDHHNVFVQLITPETKIAVEIGSWCGASTRDLARILPADGKIYAVDTWLGSKPHQIGEQFYHPVLHYLFQQFTSNVIHEKLENKIIPVRMTSVGAAAIFKMLNIRPDFIYIDGEHEYDFIKQDLEAWYPLLKEGGVFCGDDYVDPGVYRAVNEFAEKHDLLLIPTYVWRLLKK